MKILDRTTVRYYGGIKWFPKFTYEFDIEASQGERKALVDWCYANGAQCFVKGGISWGRDYIIRAVAPTQSVADRLRHFIAQYEDRQPASINPREPIPANPIDAWVVAELADRANRNRGIQ